MTSKPGETKIRVMIVDDHTLMRDTLRNILSLESDLMVVAEAESGAAAIDSFAKANPDVVLMDGSMPGMNGMETTRRLHKLRPNLKIVGLTLYAQTIYVEEMIEVGASGYVLKTGPPSDIVQAIRIVAGGGTYFDPSIPRRVGPADREIPTAELNGVELAVTKLIARGRTKNEITTLLGLTGAEVDAHRTAAMGKLGLKSRAELVRVARERGWLK
jgi:DNA-binding NarL/FixJ family response regulator